MSFQGPKPPPLVSTWYWYPTIDEPPSDAGVCHETSTPPGVATLVAALTAAGALGPAPSFSATMTVPVPLTTVAPTTFEIEYVKDSSPSPKVSPWILTVFTRICPPTPILPFHAPPA